ncbi:YraN family protein [Streptomonospora nanhaiensis]|uniref:YraN family protein n=1 Tax=Streptomonospora nanhaiensis TaxID=1323731 RepID=UPI001C391EE1|nr:YraN family protein [Streptomonospora nanhaiensis]MBV2362558.1 YraN family protein [Streptomonospora nanhaiensis]
MVAGNGPPVRGPGARRAVLGARGEEVASAYLRRAGMRILARNWRCPEGELDIVAGDGGTLVVAEVKTRTSLRFGSPLEAVTEPKRRRLRRLARRWQAEHRAWGAPTRIDVVSVLVLPGGRVFVRHHRGVA